MESNSVIDTNKKLFASEWSGEAEKEPDWVQNYCSQDASLSQEWKQIKSSILDGISEKARETRNIIGLYAYKEKPSSKLKWRDIATDLCGNKYIGQWNEETNTKEGVGIMVTKEGSIYEGYWYNEKWNGKGRWIYNNGDFYEGDFEDDLYHGSGMYLSYDIKHIQVYFMLILSISRIIYFTYTFLYWLIIMFKKMIYKLIALIKYV